VYADDQEFPSNEVAARITVDSSAESAVFAFVNGENETTLFRGKLESRF
jgi:hypothetical protein